MKYLIFILASFTATSADYLGVNTAGYYETKTQLDVTVGPDISRADLLDHYKSDICYLVNLLSEYDDEIKGAQFTFLGIDGFSVSFRFDKSDCS